MNASKTEPFVCQLARHVQFTAIHPHLMEMLVARSYFFIIKFIPVVSILSLFFFFRLQLPSLFFVQF